MNQISDLGAPLEERLAALRAITGQESFPDWVVESNNHIHAYYSFSPCTPSGAALSTRHTGLCTVDSVDHNSIAAATEMTEAAHILGMSSVMGFECHAFFDPGDPFATRKLNNPGSAGIVYMTVQITPAPTKAEVDAQLAPRRAA